MVDPERMLSAAGYQRLMEELDYLRTIRRQEVAERLKATREVGTWNDPDHQAAQEEQAFVEGRIARLEKLLAQAEVVEVPRNVASATVAMGSSVVLKDEEGETERYLIQGPMEMELPGTAPHLQPLSGGQSPAGPRLRRRGGGGDPHGGQAVHHCGDRVDGRWSLGGLLRGGALGGGAPQGVPGRPPPLLPPPSHPGDGPGRPGRRLRGVGVHPLRGRPGRPGAGCPNCGWSPPAPPASTTWTWRPAESGGSWWPTSPTTGRTPWPSTPSA